MNQFAEHQLKDVSRKVEQGRVSNNAMLKSIRGRLDQIINDMESGKTMHGIESLKELRDTMKSGQNK